MVKSKPKLIRITEEKDIKKIQAMFRARNTLKLKQKSEQQREEWIDSQRKKEVKIVSLFPKEWKQKAINFFRLSRQLELELMQFREELQELNRKRSSSAKNSAFLRNFVSQDYSKIDLIKNPVKAKKLDLQKLEKETRKSKKLHQHWRDLRGSFPFERVVELEKIIALRRKILNSKKPVELFEENLGEVNNFLFLNGL